jgi:CDP-diacylglycerol--glycerol-3-phosphate 3-phosphatidyltransferase
MKEKFLIFPTKKNRTKRTENGKRSKVFLRNIGEKIGEKIDIRLLAFRVFDDPRPKYVAKVTSIDRFFEKTILWAFPMWVRPNYVTLFRFLSVPFIIWLLWIGDYDSAMVLFIVAALSDALDGAIARTRDEITDWGIVFDPFADKLLIGLVGGILIFKFLNPILAFTIITLEVFLIASSYFRFKGEVVPAKTVGKLKMILQCVGVGFIFLSLVTGFTVFLTIATYTLYLAVLFAVLSILVYRSI